MKTGDALTIHQQSFIGCGTRFDLYAKISRIKNGYYASATLVHHQDMGNHTYPTQRRSMKLSPRQVDTLMHFEHALMQMQHEIDSTHFDYFDPLVNYFSIINMTLKSKAKKYEDRRRAVDDETFLKVFGLRLY